MRPVLLLLETKSHFFFINSIFPFSSKINFFKVPLQRSSREQLINIVFAVGLLDGSPVTSTWKKKIFQFLVNCQLYRILPPINCIIKYYYSFVPIPSMAVLMIKQRQTTSIYFHELHTHIYIHVCIYILTIVGASI